MLIEVGRALRAMAFRAVRGAGMLAEEEVTMKYKVTLHRSDEGISVAVPALPGCWSEGDTEEEALANIRDAIQEYLAALEDRLQGAEVRELEV
jgi:predicted RNase H-like HicB family nuclease